MFDFDRGAKTTGSKFLFSTGEDALRELDLIHLMVKYHTKYGYTFVIPPYLVKREIAEDAGILPRFEGQYYETTDGLILIPTAETPLVGMHKDEILDVKDLPIRYCAFSPCFRREAGTHGARDKGLKRVHQFHKVELFTICRSEESGELHQEMLGHIEDMICNLFPQLEYRIIELPENDRSPVSVKTFDIELKYGDEWLEVSSISNMSDNQTKPAQIRYRPKAGDKPVKCHMLNGSALALPRLMLALSQADQQEADHKENNNGQVPVSEEDEAAQEVGC